MGPRTFVSTKLSSSGPGHHHRDDKFPTNRLCGLEPPAAFAAAPPRGRALDWGHRAPPQGGKPKKKGCQIKIQTGDGQKFATVARAHGQAKQLGHKRANLNDAPPQAPECQCCHGPVVRRVANFCPEKAHADDSAYCNNTEIGGVLGGSRGDTITTLVS